MIGPKKCFEHVPPSLSRQIDPTWFHLVDLGPHLVTHPEHCFQVLIRILPSKYMLKSRVKELPLAGNQIDGFLGRTSSTRNIMEPENGALEDLFHFTSYFRVGFRYVP